MPGAVFLVVWQLIVQDDPQRQFLFGSPASVLSVLWEDLRNRSLLADLRLTALESLCGLAIGAVAGTCIGLVLWIRSTIAFIARPYVTLLGAIPVFSLAPMLIIWFGTGFLS